MKKRKTAPLHCPNFPAMESRRRRRRLEKPRRNWQELPTDVMVTILMKLEPREILKSLQFVCKSWHEACKDPAVWSKVEIRFSWDQEYLREYKQIAEAAVNRSRGHLLEISLAHVCDDKLLLLIAERSSNLRCLRVWGCSDSLSKETFFKAFGKLPLLEEAEFTMVNVEGSWIRFLGQSCPKLVSFKLNKQSLRYPDRSHIDKANDCALAIAEAMPRIRHLQLKGSMMTNEGLQAILDSCSCLESLDLRACDRVQLSLLGKRCEEKVKVLKWPHDSTEDYGFPGSIGMTLCMYCRRRSASLCSDFVCPSCFMVWI